MSATLSALGVVALVIGVGLVIADALKRGKAAGHLSIRRMYSRTWGSLAFAGLLTVAAGGLILWLSAR
jgi:hypothetical protein